tara:strand:+ start:96 stop:746 length:651 start_codon:yes stop_codon:yes gene_type:complete
MKMELTVPNKLSEITLKQYQKFLKIQETNTDDAFLRFKMIEIFCNIDAQAVRQLRLSDTDKIIEILNNVFEEKPQLTETFKLGDVEYGFIPKLEDISLGEYVDLDTYIGNWDQMHVAMNVLYRPIKDKIKDKYTIKEYDTDAEKPLDEIPLDIVFGAIFFFYNLGIDLSKTMMNYLETEEEQNLMHKQILGENGDGINQSLPLLKEILEDLKISLN